MATSTRRRRNRIPAKACELAWPASWGYGGTEWHQCNRPATHRAYEVAWVGQPNDGQRQRVLLCGTHAAAWQAGRMPYGYTTRAYRWRWLRNQHGERY